MPRIKGKRIMLREYMRSDVECIRKWVNDADTTQFLDPPAFLYPHPMEKTVDFVEANIENGGPAFVIANASTGEYIGQIDLANVDYRTRSADIGIVIGVPAYRSKGYGAEAINLLLNFAFIELNLHRVAIKVYDFNTRAVKCYEKCGFTVEGRLREAVYVNGVFHDVMLMSMLREEFYRLD